MYKFIKLIISVGIRKGYTLTFMTNYNKTLKS